MPIITLQRQLREIGRIRIGNQVATANGRRRPAKLTTFRITSSSREMIEAAAAEYGGVVTPWDNGGNAEFEVITTTAVLDIVVPPGQAVSQWYELWSGGGCQRRCDGETNVLTMGPCLCPAEVDQRLALAAKGEACKATTRLNVMLPALPDLGVFRLESHGYYAAVELAGAAEILAMASASGRLIPARLRLEQRSKKEPGKPTKQYAVPVIEFVETRFADLAISGGQVPAQLASGRVERPQLPSTTLPDRSDLRAQPVSADPVGDLFDELPATPTNVDPETGEVLGPDMAEDTGEEMGPDVVWPAGGPEITRKAFIDAVAKKRLGKSAVELACRNRFDARSLGQLTGIELAQLAVVLELEVAPA